MSLGQTPIREKVLRGGGILLLLVASALAVFSVDEIERALAAGPTLWITAEQTRELRAGAPVWVAGRRAGRVTRVTLRPPGSAADRRVLVRAVLREDAADRLRSDATASIAPPGLLEPPVVHLEPGSPDAPGYDFADTLRARTGVTGEELMARTERARAVLDTLLRREARLRALADTGPGTLARLRGDVALREQLRALRGELSLAARRARSGTSTAARIAAGDGPVADLQESLADAESLAARAGASADRWSGLAGGLASLRARADSVAGTLSRAEGSAGRFLHDEALARELAELRERVRSVQADLLANPFAWLRFGLF